MAHVEDTIGHIQWGLEIKPSNVHVKERYRQKNEEGREQYEKWAEEKKFKTVMENGLKFEVNLSDYLDTGLFMDHRPARQWIKTEAKGQRVLNLFAYTGSFSIYALAGEARQVTSVDLSNTYTQWTEGNAELNGFHQDKRLECICADVLQWLNEQKQSKVEPYDLIICDPPTFSNSKKMNSSSFVVDRDYPWLLSDMSKILSPEGKIFFSNNSRGFQLDDERLPKGFIAKNVTKSSIPQDFRNPKIHQAWWIFRE
jgi:23S rRNA G2069 N7-methylase RlmK/C1962 C5-methylase RlmI